MKEVLNQFSDRSCSLFGCTSDFLKKLNIEFGGEETAEPISIADFYDDGMPKYLMNALQYVQATYYIGIINDKSLKGEVQGDSFADIAEKGERGDRYEGMAVFACDAKNGGRLTRTEASALTRALNRISDMPVILLIREYRKEDNSSNMQTFLSLSTCERVAAKTGGEKLGKVSILRNINCAAPHRGHIDILDSLGDKAYPTFEELYKHWMEVFSNELLTKKFYTELSDWYAWAVKVAKFPNNIHTVEDDIKFNHEACIRLITRLIFVWFLKQKHLIPEEFFDEKYICENLIDNFNPHDTQNLLYNTGESKYYRLILQNLFFAMLNCPIVAEGKTTPDNRRFRGDGQNGYVRDGYNVNNLMRYKSEFAEDGADKFVKLANHNVPFLNGGLFDCLDDKPNGLYYDGFSERKESLEQLFIPDYLFFGDEVGSSVDLSQWYNDKKKKNVSARGIIDILKRYSFTIEENTPYDQEVSLDPELLGKVFENLLAAYNPETNQSARKQTGSYYTPREIVQYMVDESLVAHLKRVCGDEMEPQYRQLLSYVDTDIEISDDQRKNIMNAIYNCRVLDPACGSGAFPMGILQQMVHILKCIDPSNKMWESMMMDIAIDDARRELQKIASDNDEERENIEKNKKARLNDIENAFNQSINDPDYARKLYLIEHCIYGVDIQPIATQISKLRFFISLVVDQKPTKDAKTNFGIRPLPNLEAKFVTANTLIPLDRSQDLFSSSDDILFYEEMLQDINHRIFLAKKNSIKKQLQQKMVATRATMAQVMQNNGFIGNKGYDQLMSWNMFDQNASAGFFDSEWMFGVKDGFDVVIGNPPYVRRTSIAISDKKNYEKLYTSAQKQYDLYLLFIERGIMALHKQGYLCYINPIRFFNSDYGEGCRKYIMKECAIKSIMDISQLPVFEKTLTYPCVLLLEKGCNKDNYICYRHPKDLKDVLDFDSRSALVFPQSTFSSMNCLFIVPTNSNIPDIISKIDNNCEYINDYYKVARGLPNNKVVFDETGYCAIKSTCVDRYKITGQEIHINTNFGDKFTPEMIILPRTVRYLKSTLKRKNLVPLDRIYYLIQIENNVINNKYTIGIINSKLTNFWFEYKYSSTKVSGNYFDLNGNQIKSIPIPVNKMFVDKISNFVTRILEAQGDTIIEQQIDHIVYHLYNLTYDEVLVIDPETPITREEYENWTLQ